MLSVLFSITVIFLCGMILGYGRGFNDGRMEGFQKGKAVARALSEVSRGL